RKKARAMRINLDNSSVSHCNITGKISSQRLFTLSIHSVHFDNDESCRYR
uniref:Dipeptidyl peptidase family member 1 n=1 Tax=Parascaris univalens TaxID=6257 RepID=A0A915CEX8_PARUN